MSYESEVNISESWQALNLLPEGRGFGHHWGGSVRLFSSPCLYKTTLHILATCQREQRSEEQSPIGAAWCQGPGRRSAITSLPGPLPISTLELPCASPSWLHCLQPHTHSMLPRATLILPPRPKKRKFWILLGLGKQRNVEWLATTQPPTSCIVRASPTRTCLGPPVLRAAAKAT
jgi:hypothetical protein